MTKDQKSILILGNPNSWSTQELEKAVVRSGNIPVVYEPGDLFVYLSEEIGRDKIYFRKKESDKAERLYTKNIDAVISRLGSGTKYGKYVVKAFQNQGIFCANISEGIDICGDKFKTAQVLSKARQPIPKQILCYQSRNPEEVINLIDKKPPVMAKKISGSQGKGIFILPDGLTAKMIMESFSDEYLVIQRMLSKNSPDKKSDIRAFVIGAETSKPEVYAYERTSENDDPRSNFSIHHSGKPYEMCALLEQIAILSAKAVGCGIAGVDLMIDKRKDGSEYEFVLEVNSNPSLEGISGVLKVNIAEKIVAYVLRECDRPSKNKPFLNNLMANSADIGTPTMPQHNTEVMQTLQSLESSLNNGLTYGGQMFSFREQLEKVQTIIAKLKNR
jgi:ribosomal protein S6--L-glutamate ligase